MATVDSNFFEIQRRGYLWKANSTLDDGSTSLGYDNNPNLAVSGNTPGETKLVSMPIGAFYVVSNGDLYFKTAMPNTWQLVSLGNSGNNAAGPRYETYSFETAALEWTVTHNKGTTNFTKNLFDVDGNEFFAKVNIIDGNSFKVQMTESTSGKVTVVFPPA